MPSALLVGLPYRSSSHRKTRPQLEHRYSRYQPIARGLLWEGTWEKVLAFALVLGAAPVVAKLASGALGKAIFMVGLGCLNRLAGALLGVVLGVLAWAYVLATIGQIGFRGAKAVAEGPTLDSLFLRNPGGLEARQPPLKYYTWGDQRHLPPCLASV